MGMFQVTKSISTIAVAAAFVAALPGMAHAGTSDDQGSAVFDVVTQCSVTGANVDLGAFLTTQTWGDVAKELGEVNSSNPDPIYGTKGKTYVKWGSVTCNKDLEYFVQMHGSTASARVVFTHNGKAIGFLPFVEELGGVTGFGIPGASIAGTGKSLYLGFTATGTGARQDMLGSAMLRFGSQYTSVTPTDVIGGPPTALTDTLNYKLTF